MRKKCNLLFAIKKENLQLHGQNEAGGNSRKRRTEREEGERLLVENFRRLKKRRMVLPLENQKKEKEIQSSKLC